MPSRYHACQHCYTVYGYAPVASEGRSVLGFNGQHRSLGTDLYVLGNGYRIYSTTLNRFYSADHLSPFGHGGINAYAYCAGDPVNRDDPSGHMWRTRGGNTLQTTGRQPAGRQLTRPNSVSSSRSSSVESLSSSSSSRSRSRSPVIPITRGCDRRIISNRLDGLSLPRTGKLTSFVDFQHVLNHFY